MSITSATAVLTLMIPGVFNTPQILQNFAADDIYDFDAVPMAEVQRGADGILSGGFVFGEIVQRITLKADSTSIAVFQAWQAAEFLIKDKYPAEGSVTLTSISQEFVQTNGILMAAPFIPNAKRVLQPMTFTIQWGSVQSVPVNAA